MFVVVIFLIRCDLFDTVFFFACTFWGRLWNYWFTEQLSTTGKSSVKEMSPYLKSLWARFYIVLQKMIYVFTRQNIFSQNAACLSAPLTVTSKSPIFKGHVCMLSTFFCQKFSTVLARRARVTRTCCLRYLVFLEAESWLHFGIAGHRFFRRVDAIMNLKQFDVMADRKLSIIRFLFFGFTACLLFAAEQRWLD